MVGTDAQGEEDVCRLAQGPLKWGLRGWLASAGLKLEMILNLLLLAQPGGFAAIVSVLVLDPPSGGSAVITALLFAHHDPGDDLGVIGRRSVAAPKRQFTDRTGGRYDRWLLFRHSVTAGWCGRLASTGDAARLLFIAGRPIATDLILVEHVPAGGLRLVRRWGCWSARHVSKECGKHVA